MHALTLREKARIITASGYTSAAQTSGVPGGVVDQEEPEEDFFLPDICQAQSILLLVLIAELLVFVVVLANSRLIGFNWVQFGLASLFVQWIVLLSAAVLCNFRPLLMKMSVSCHGNWIRHDSFGNADIQPGGRVVDADGGNGVERKFRERCTKSNRRGRYGRYGISLFLLTASIEASGAGGIKLVNTGSSIQNPTALSF